MKSVRNGLYAALAAFFLAACASAPPVTVIQRVPQYVQIPPALLQACPGADWSKVQTWRDLAVAASVEKAARAKCAAEIEAIGKLKPGGAQ